ncbi:MAG TPA: polysaccharide deacetylase [Alphaproteobacteria bacterium]|nr:polysaccharide deacetylase [Alphaproteobacteria bacterium]HAJ48690.1 polysaccharide deacetylase [Alphaproteobacteria bacterium]
MGKYLVMGLAIAFSAFAARAEVVRTLVPNPHRPTQIALTFDACEAWERVSFDRKILDYLVQNQIPTTIFVTGRFARDNANDLQALSKLPFVEIANHSWSHPNTMDRMALDKVKAEVTRAEDEVLNVTGRKPSPYFRFPAGVYDSDTLSAVEELGYQVVHWRWAVGDPDRSMTATKIRARVAAQTKPNDILIFHINGRGWHTGEALPEVIADLRAKGFQFVTLSEGLGGAEHQAARKPSDRFVATNPFDRIMRWAVNRLLFPASENRKDR